MTNYSKWDSKATALCKEQEEEDKNEKEAADKALGIEGGLKGPPTAKAEAQHKELVEHSDKRKEFIEWSKNREIQRTHKQQEEPIRLEGEEYSGKAVKLSECEDVVYVVPEVAPAEEGQPTGLVKLIFDRCKRVRVQIQAPIMTSSIDICRCDQLTLELTVPLGTVQVDECTAPVLISFAEKDHVGQIYHQNSPGLSIGMDGAGGSSEAVGKAGGVQYYTRMISLGSSSSLTTDVVRRGEGEFPIGLGTGAEAQAGYPGRPCEQPEPEAPPQIEEKKRKAEVQRQKANDMFRASDFMQAACEYTLAMELDPTCAALWANRAACMMKLGRTEEALEDASKCVELDPTNAKGWFRKGASLQKLERWAEAIPAYIEAEKLEPKNEDVQRGIKFSQFRARSQ